MTDSQKLARARLCTVKWLGIPNAEAFLASCSPRALHLIDRLTVAKGFKDAAKQEKALRAIARKAIPA